MEPTILFMENIVFFETYLLPFLWAIVHDDCPRSFLFSEVLEISSISNLGFTCWISFAPVFSLIYC